MASVSFLRSLLTTSPALDLEYPSSCTAFAQEPYGTRRRWWYFEQEYVVGARGTLLAATLTSVGCERARAAENAAALFGRSDSVSRVLAANTAPGNSMVYERLLTREHILNGILLGRRGVHDGAGSLRRFEGNAAFVESRCRCE